MKKIVLSIPWYQIKIYNAKSKLEEHQKFHQIALSSN